MTGILIVEPFIPGLISCKMSGTPSVQNTVAILRDLEKYDSAKVSLSLSHLLSNRSVKLTSTVSRLRSYIVSWSKVIHRWSTRIIRSIFPLWLVMHKYKMPSLPTGV